MTFCYTLLTFVIYLESKLYHNKYINMQDNYTVLHFTDLRRSLDRNVGQFYILDVHVYFNIYGFKIPY